MNLKSSSFCFFSLCILSFITFCQIISSFNLIPNAKDTNPFYEAYRYYDPKLGRFTQPDTVVPTVESIDLNRYAYVRNNPIKYNDTSGHVPNDVLDDALAALKAADKALHDITTRLSYVLTFPDAGEDPIGFIVALGTMSSGGGGKAAGGGGKAAGGGGKATGSGNKITGGGSKAGSGMARSSGDFIGPIFIGPIDKRRHLKRMEEAVIARLEAEKLRAERTAHELTDEEYSRAVDMEFLRSYAEPQIRKLADDLAEAYHHYLYNLENPQSRHLFGSANRPRRVQIHSYDAVAVDSVAEGWMCGDGGLLFTVSERRWGRPVRRGLRFRRTTFFFDNHPILVVDEKISAEEYEKRMRQLQRQQPPRSKEIRRPSGD